jgi:hypothetical protein
MRSVGQQALLLLGEFFVGEDSRVAQVARPFSALGTAAIACGAFDKVLYTFPTEMPAACAAAAAWAASPPGLVFCDGDVNGVSVVANADAAA